MVYNTLLLAPASKIKDVIMLHTGQKFNKLTILCEPYKSKKYPKSVNVICECGIKTTVNLYSLQNGQTKSCGCLLKEYRNNMSKLRRINISYEELYQLYIIEQKSCSDIAKMLKHSRSIIAKLLKEYNFKIRQYKRKLGKNNPMWKGYDNISNKYWSNIKNNAKIRNLEFNISIEYVNELLIQQNFKCKLSGVEITPPNLSKNSDLRGTASLDRIDSTKGYIINNIQWIHKDLQDMKMDKTDQEFIQWCNIITNFQSSLLAVS